MIPLKKTIHFCLPGLILIALSLLLILPQLLTHDLIIGADALFHYNRFYDTAMQIKTGNFHYFMSTFGFQQSGRIVNALYGPLFAYVQGLLVLLAGSWFHYQLLANFIIALLAGSSMFLLLRHYRLQRSLSLPLAGLFMMTYAIQYWPLNQGFTGWGTCLMPLGLIPLSRIVNEQKIPVWQTGAVIALITQVHLLSALMLVAVYLPFVISAFVSGRPLQLLKQLGQTLLLYLGLTINIWTTMFFLYRHNRIIAPFVNRHMARNAINAQSWFWVALSFSLIILVLTAVIPLCRHWRQLSRETKIIWLTSLALLLLSTDFLPWDQWIQDKFIFAELLQFPFRFFAPFTVLVIAGYGRLLKELPAAVPHMSRVGPYFLTFLVGLSFLQTTAFSWRQLEKWPQINWHVNAGIHNYNFGSNPAIRRSFYSHDLQETLTVMQKSTPDYLPLVRPTQANKYDLYASATILNPLSVKKQVTTQGLLLTWSGAKVAQVSLPIIMYHESQLQDPHTKKLILPQRLSAIGAPTVVNQTGQNQLLLTFKAPFKLRLILGLLAVFWLATLSVLLFQLLPKMPYKPIKAKWRTNHQDEQIKD